MACFSHNLFTRQGYRGSARSILTATETSFANTQYDSVLLAKLEYD